MKTVVFVKVPGSKGYNALLGHGGPVIGYVERVRGGWMTKNKRGSRRVYSRQVGGEVLVQEWVEDTAAKGSPRTRR